jgi:nucleoporin POM152
MQSDAAALIAEQERLLGLSSSFDNLSDDEDDEFDEYDGSANRLEDTKKYLTQRDPQQLVLPSSSSLIRSALSLERSQEIIYLRVTRPGLIRLDSLLDANTTPVRVYRSAKGDEVMVVECPTARFEPDRLASTQCLGSQQELNLRVRGTAPMTLAWHHDNRGKSESFIVNGIQGSSEVNLSPTTIFPDGI